MRPAIGIVLMALVLSSSTGANFREPVDGSTPTLDTQEYSWDLFSRDASGSSSGSGYNCDQVCDTLYDPVCGTDGVTYANDCAFSVAQCKKSDLRVLAEGECGGTYFAEDFLPGSETIGTDVKPTKPVDGSTPTLDTQEYSWDFFSRDASGSSSGSGYNCDRACETDYDPVCGTDGVTYANDCAFSVAQCKKSDLRVLAEGECAGKSIATTAEASVSGSADAICPDACLDIFDPVSDENGNQYMNECSMRMAKCKDTKKDVDILAKCKKLYEQTSYHSSAGADPISQECASVLAAVAAKNTNTPSTKQTTQAKRSMQMPTTTKVSSANVTGGDSLHEDKSDGVIDGSNSSSTTKCVDTCLELYSPVCGSDGISYVNLCQLKLAACKNPKLNLVETDEDQCEEMLR